MLKKFSLLLTLIATLGLTGCDHKQIPSTASYASSQNIPAFSLADYNHYSASVLPTITEKGELYAILSRETTGSPKKKDGTPNTYGKFHKYDDFSGGKDKDETHAEETAAHEFFQEAMLEKTLGWDLAKTREFIKPENKNTWAVLAYSAEDNPNALHIRKSRNVTYLTSFDDYMNQFCNNFSDARKQEIAQYKKNGTPKWNWTNAEKDRIAKVKWSDLRTAILDEEDPTAIITVGALVMNPRTKRFERKTIDLRPFLVVKLRPFLLDETYEQGEHKKIRHYQE